MLAENIALSRFLFSRVVRRSGPQENVSLVWFLYFVQCWGSNATLLRTSYIFKDACAVPLFFSRHAGSTLQHEVSSTFDPSIVSLVLRYSYSFRSSSNSGIGYLAWPLPVPDIWHQGHDV